MTGLWIPLSFGLLVKITSVSVGGEAQVCTCEFDESLLKPHVTNVKWLYRSGVMIFITGWDHSWKSVQFGAFID